MYQLIKTMLEEKRMNFSDLSKQTGIRESVFANLKARGGCLGFENARKVAKALGVPMEALAAEEVSA